MKWLHEKVYNYTESSAYPFHMPGSKGKNYLSDEIGKYDITEIEGFDDLRHPDGILYDLEKGWAELYGAKNAHLLVNGSTCGNLSMIYAATTQNGAILVLGNHHWSVDNAAEIRNLKVYSIQSEKYEEGFDKPINPQKVKETLERHKDIETVIITSPTYEGVVSDIKNISEIAHKNGVSLIVDCAHGAHMGKLVNKPEYRNILKENNRAQYWIQNPITQGADAVVVSLHKTLPVMGQTSLVMTPLQEGLISDERLKHYINIFQTSSPSYVLLSTASAALKDLTENGNEKFKKWYLNLHKFFNDTLNLKNIEVLSYDTIEMSKIIISTKKTDVSGKIMDKILRDNYSVYLEKSTDFYLIGMTSINDTDEGFKRLSSALHEIDTGKV